MNVISRRFALLAVAVGLCAGSPVSSLVRADDAAATTAPAKANPVDFRKLKECLPESLAGLARDGSGTGQKTTMGEMSISTAEGRYGKDEGDNPKHGQLSLMDYGNDEFVKMMAMWQNTDIDQESDDEYTKTVDLQGRKAMLTYNKKDKRGSVQTLGGKRVLVSLELYGVSDEEFKKAADELPLKKLDEVVAAAAK